MDKYINRVFLLLGIFYIFIHNVLTVIQTNSNSIILILFIGALDSIKNEFFLHKYNENQLVINN